MSTYLVALIAGPYAAWTDTYTTTTVKRRTKNEPDSLCLVVTAIWS